MKTEEEKIAEMFESAGGKIAQATPEQLAEIERAQAESKAYMAYLAAGGKETPDGKVPPISAQEKTAQIGDQAEMTISPVSAPSANLSSNLSTSTPVKRERVPVTVADDWRVSPLLPKDMDQAMRMAMAYAGSKMLPKSYYTDGQELAATKAFTAMQCGAEVGLPPLQAIQSIAVVNGVATLWGDAQRGLVERSGACEYVQESYEPVTEDCFIVNDKGAEIPNLKFTAVCVTKRRGRKDVVRETFSVADAIRAGLWGKAGPWKSHPKRMLRYKARAFCLRDTYPDVLKGLTHSTEEMMSGDFGVSSMIDVTDQSAVPSNPAEHLKSLQE